MAINWFPGHMHKARKEIKQFMPQVDLIIEVLDARIPFSSGNPLVPALRGEKPVIKVLNKSDLADPSVTEAWQAALEREQGIKAIALSQGQRTQTLGLLKLARRMLSHRNLEHTALRVLILGIPNVGKSTLINTLAGRPIAKTGNEPAVTKSRQQIKLPENVLLFDTPGFLWPKLSPAACGYRLAATGAIKSAVIEFEDVALFAAEYLLAAYPDALRERYRLEQLPPVGEPDSGLGLLEAIAVRRAFYARKGVPDLHKVSEVLLNEFRSGTLGRISLETPAMVAEEQARLRSEKEESTPETH